MSWRDRAIKVDEGSQPPAGAAPAASGDWRARADAVQDPALTQAAEAIVPGLQTGDVTPPEVPGTPAAAVSAYLRRIFKAHNPFPTSQEEIRGALTPTPGKVGAGRFLEEEGKRVGAAARGAGMNMAEDFVELPGVRQFPEAAATAGATGSAVVDILSDTLTPSGAAQNIGGDVLLRGLKGAELAARARVAEKVSGLPPHVARAVRTNPEFFETTKGTPEALDASNAALQDIIQGAKSGHVADRTMAREFIRPIELADVESGVRDIQGVIKGARAKAGAGIQAEKEALGFKSLDEQAQEIASRGLPGKMGDEDLVRAAVKALDPSKPPQAAEIEGLVQLRQAIDDRVKFGERDINPPGTRMAALLKNLRSKINARLGGPMEADLESFPMEPGVPREPTGTGPAGAEQPFGAPLRAAEQEFARVARITDPLTKKFDTVPRGVSSVKTSMQEGLRSVDPELQALQDLSGGREALAKAEGAEARFLEGEKAFKQDLRRFDPLAGRFETTPKGMETVRGVMREGTEAVDPDMKTIKSLPKGEQALERMKAEVNRFDAERVDVSPDSTAEAVAQIVGITPQRAARWLSQSVHGGAFPGLSKAAAVLGQAAARGPEAMATQHYLLQQQDPEYRAAIQALQAGESEK